MKGVNLILRVDTIFHLLRKKWALIFEIFGSHFEIITKQCRSEVSRKKELFYALKTKQKLKKIQTYKIAAIGITVVPFSNHAGFLCLAMLFVF